MYNYIHRRSQLPLINIVACPADLESHPKCACIRRVAVNGSKFYLSGDPAHLALCVANLGAFAFLLGCSTNPVCISSTAYSTGSLGFSLGMEALNRLENSTGIL